MLALEALKNYWGFDSFRNPQLEIIQSVLQGKDTLGLLPTGAGKSICFQVPVLCQEGIGIVISPLIALMNDQVQNLQKKGIAAVALHSALSKSEIDILLDQCIDGQFKFLYLSPERLRSNIVLERIKQMDVNLIAIDEAHCISQWGYDFRPAYLEIKAIREILPRVPILALTATATSKVMDDIIEKLELKNPSLFRISFERKNLHYLVFPEENKLRRMLNIFAKVPGSAVVYVRNRRQTEEIAKYLNEQNISADFYHAGLNFQQRNATQEAWINNHKRVIVATNAFGMGIDKPDVRSVVHLDLPDSLEAYYQEAGRAGRDGALAYATVLYGQHDIDDLQRKTADAQLKVDDIRRVYDLLFQYYSIAFGSGQHQHFNFDIVEFCQQYSVSIYTVIQVLRYLERAKLLELSDEAYNPSRVHILLNTSDLYAFQVANIQLDPLIKTMLRSYSGLFDQYVNIHEHELSRRLGLRPVDVREQLKQLHNYQVLEYIQGNKKPIMQFLTARVNAKDLMIDHRFIEERNKNTHEKTEAMIHYLKAKQCRSQLLLAYFDQLDARPCGTCDYCISAKNTDNQELVTKEIKIRLLSLKPTEKLSLPQLLNLWPDLTEPGIKEGIKILIDEGFIQFNDKNEVIVLN